MEMGICPHPRFLAPDSCIPSTHSFLTPHATCTWYLIGQTPNQNLSSPEDTADLPDPHPTHLNGSPHASKDGFTLPLLRPKALEVSLMLSCSTI